MAYHQLFIRTQGTWCAEFGDRERACVMFERDDNRASGVLLKDTKIVQFKRVPTTKQLAECQARLNGVIECAASKSSPLKA